MQIELLKEIVTSIAGDKSKGLVNLLYGKKNVNEFVISKKMNLTINQTRNILYKLSDEGLVSFIRKKDSKKGGWYTYFWTLNEDRSLTKFKEHLVKKIADLNSNAGSKKTERFFYCQNCSVEMNEENALQNNYTCPECGEPLELKDNSKELLVLEKEIARMNQMLAEVDSQLTEVISKGEKARVRRHKSQEKKKKKERDEKRKKMKKARDLEKSKEAKSSKKALKKPSKKR